MVEGLTPVPALKRDKTRTFGEALTLRPKKEQSSSLLREIYPADPLSAADGILSVAN